jgi:hypothetical protein
VPLSKTMCLLFCIDFSFFEKNIQTKKKKRTRTFLQITSGSQTVQYMNFISVPLSHLLIVMPLYHYIIFF